MLTNRFCELADIVISTMGPWGRTVWLKKGSDVFSSRDGYNVINYLNPGADPESIVAHELLRQTAKRTADDAGDATTTTVAIAKGIVRIFDQSNYYDSMKALVGFVPPDIPESCLVNVDDEVLMDVIKTAAAGDDRISNVVYEVVKMCGKNGAIYIEEAPYQEDITYEYSSGYVCAGQIESVLFLGGHKEIEFDAHIFPMGNACNDQRDLINVYKAYKSSGTQKPLVIVSTGLSGSGFEMMMKNFVETKLPIIGFAIRDTNAIMDIAEVTGGKFFSTYFGHSYRDIKSDFFGNARVILSKDKINILYDKNERVIEYANKVEDADRKAKILGGVAKIKIGGPTPITRFKIAQQVEDAKCTGVNAVKDGVVCIGGGYTQYMWGMAMGGIVGEALKYVASLPAANAGIIINDFSEGGWDARTGNLSKDIRVYDGYTALISAVKNGVICATEVINSKTIAF